MTPAPRPAIALRVVLALVIGRAPMIPAQVSTNSTTSPLGRALMAERNGAFADAATQYAAILGAQPANVGALIGMEHVLPRLARQGELIVLVSRAVAVDSANVGVLGVAVRAFASQGLVDSARRYVERWSRLAPHDEDPFREWSAAAATARDAAQARLALDVGRQQLGPRALGIERAEMFQRTGDMAGAVQEWVGVVHYTPVLRDAAVTVLSQVAATQRTAVTDALAHDPSRDARQMLGFLQASWGEPAQGAATLRSALPDNRDSAAILLRKLYDVLRTRDDRPSRATAAATLESLASMGPDATFAPTMLDAARGYADAGDEGDARRVLGLVAAKPGAPSGLATTASTTLLGVLIAEGRAADAEHALADLAGKIDADEHDALARRIAVLWLRQGSIDKANALVAADSSTDGLDLRGRLRLYRGDLAGANDLLRAAGPYDDARDASLQRVTLLTMIQAVDRDSAQALGLALLAAERGDTATAVRGLDALAATLHGDGAAELRVFAARLALAARDSATATRLLHAADVSDAPGPAAAARLALARISVAMGRRDEAQSILERLIVDFPESAAVPEARRLRDLLAGAIPGGGG